MIYAFFVLEINFLYDENVNAETRTQNLLYLLLFFNLHYFVISAIFALFDYAHLC